MRGTQAAIAGRGVTQEHEKATSRSEDSSPVDSHEGSEDGSPTAAKLNVADDSDELGRESLERNASFPKFLSRPMMPHAVVIAASRLRTYSTVSSQMCVVLSY